MDVKRGERDNEEIYKMDDWNWGYTEEKERWKDVEREKNEEGED